MTIVTKSVVINAPREKIRPYVDDANNLRSWNKNVYRWEAGDGWPAEGASGVIGFKTTGGINVDGVMTVLAYDPQTLNRRYQIASADENMEPSMWEYSYEEEGGKTTVTAHVQYTLPGSYLGQIIDKLVVERGNAKLLEESLQTLKSMVEGSA